jgi:hypothetical protein
MTLQERIEKLEKELAELKAKCNIEYPIFKRSKENGYIVKFTGLKKGSVIYIGDSDFCINHLSFDWIPHTNTDIWEDIAYDEKRKLFDKQLVWCWDEHTKCARQLKFYDAKNKCVFDSKGYRTSIIYDHYKPWEGEYPDWAKEAYKILED